MSVSNTFLVLLKAASQHFDLSDDVTRGAQRIYDAWKPPSTIEPQIAVCACIVRSQEENPGGFSRSLKEIAEFFKIYDGAHWESFGKCYNRTSGNKNGVPSSDEYMLLSQLTPHISHRHRRDIGFTAAKLLSRCSPHSFCIEDSVAGCLLLACIGHEFESVDIKDIRRAMDKLGSRENLALVKSTPMKFMPPCRRRLERRELRVKLQSHGEIMNLSALRATLDLAKKCDYSLSVIQNLQKQITRMAPPHALCDKSEDDPEAPLESFDDEIEEYYLNNNQEIEAKESIFDTLHPDFDPQKLPKLQKKSRNLDTRANENPMTPSEFHNYFIKTPASSPPCSPPVFDSNSHMKNIQTPGGVGWCCVPRTPNARRSDEPYLDQHDIMSALQDTLEQVIKCKPEEPYDFMADCLHSRKRVKHN